jgi:hypothetical protein
MTSTIELDRLITTRRRRRRWPLVLAAGTGAILTTVATGAAYVVSHAGNRPLPGGIHTVEVYTVDDPISTVVAPQDRPGIVGRFIGMCDADTYYMEVGGTGLCLVLNGSLGTVRATGRRPRHRRPGHRQRHQVALFAIGEQGRHDRGRPDQQDPRREGGTRVGVARAHVAHGGPERGPRWIRRPAGRAHRGRSPRCEARDRGPYGRIRAEKEGLRRSGRPKRASSTCMAAPAAMASVPRLVSETWAVSQSARGTSVRTASEITRR